MRLSNIAHLYVVRLKARIVLIQECFAILGIAVGVALLFASQVASASLNGSVHELTSELVGGMQFQLDARGAEGFSESLLTGVRQMPGVQSALPILEQRANLIGPRGQRSIDLIGTDPQFAHSAGPLLRRFSASQLASQRAIALPSPVASAVGAGPLENVKLQIGASIAETVIGTTLGQSEIGGLVHSPVAIAPLVYTQKISGQSGRVTRIFVQAKHGDERLVHQELLRLAASRLNVEPANFDSKLFAVASAPANQGEGLFSGLSALVGFMFAINAMLLTVHLRRGLIRSLRLNGATRKDIMKALLFDALVLGVLASILGLVLGDVLSLSLFRSNPSYLSFAFPVGSERIIDWQSVALAVAAGLLAACVGVLGPLLESLSWLGEALLSGEHRKHLPWEAIRLAIGLVCLALTTVILIFAAQLAILGTVTLVLALLLFLAPMLDRLVGAFDQIQSRFGTASSQIAVVELRSPRTRTRSMAIAATGAVAVFGSVSIQGAHANLQHGLDRLFHDVTAVADVWVVPPGAQNLLATAPFSGTNRSGLEHLPGVQSVGDYRAGFLNYGDRRVWVLAPPSATTRPIPATQLLAGDIETADARLSHGGWAVISKAIASEHHLHIGQSFQLPSPVPSTFRVAALTTNLGWPPGAIILSPDDYTHAWGNANPTAYTLTLDPGVPVGRGMQEVRRALGPRSGLVVQSSGRRDALQQAASRQGLARLTQISTLMLIATVLAISVAMSTMIWQRRPQLARMKVQGFTQPVLWRAMLWETAVLLGAGCSIGAVFGVFGQILISHALASVTGFPVVLSTGALEALGSFALVSAVAVAIVAIPGHRAASIPAHV